MRYRNTAPHALSFSIGEGLYDVPAGALVEVEDKWSYCVATRGLPLVEAEQEAGPVVRPSFAARKPVVKMPPGMELTTARVSAEEDEDEDGDTSPDLASDLVPPDVAEALKPRTHGKKRGK